MPKQSETFLLADDTPPIKQPEKKPPEQLMLDWLLQRWPHQTVSSKQIYQYAPHSIRFDRENAIKTAEILERYGWLARLPTRHQRNWRVWKIMRRADLYPKVAG